MTFPSNQRLCRICRGGADIDPKCIGESWTDQAHSSSVRTDDTMQKVLPDSDSEDIRGH